MIDTKLFYINGKWTAPATSKLLDVENPATEKVIAQISLGSQADVDRAVAAARAAFDSYSQTTPAQRIALLERIVAEKGVTNAQTLARYRDAWDHAADRTPHGDPIELKPEDFA